jgi:2-oxoisovalerate dehydrogenase E1 component alpha subunit
MQRRGEDAVALALIGDGATSEGDFHEALNFAAVFKAPVVFFVQNNRYAISVPFEKQSAAPALAYKGIGYGMRSEQVDGNDAVAVLAVLDDAVKHAREGKGPVLVEAHTYRIDAHTNADDATRYRDADEVAKWREADPLKRLETYLEDDLTENEIELCHAEAEEFAQSVRDVLNADAELDPMSLFDHVYAEPTRQLQRQRAMVAAELEA